MHYDKTPWVTYVKIWRPWWEWKTLKIKEYSPPPSSSSCGTMTGLFQLIETNLNSESNMLNGQLYFVLLFEGKYLKNVEVITENSIKQNL